MISNDYMELKTMSVLWNVSATAATFAVCAFASFFIYKRLKKTVSIRAIDAFKLNINVASRSEECKPFINEIRRRSMAHGHNAIGFDCEWVSNGPRRPIALLQLSTFDGYCVLVRMNLLDDIPASLRKLLEDEDIYKVGVVPLNDAKYLYQDHGVLTKATIDLRCVAEMCGHKGRGLAYLADTMLGVELDKRLKVRCSNWDADTLSPAQLHYAASDAHASIRIFVKLINQLDTKAQRKSLGLHPEESMWDSLGLTCSRFVDYNFKQTNGITKNGRSKSTNKDTSKYNSKRYPNCLRKKPLYDNCFLQAPDGDLLCTCDKKKALWYIDKGLADQIESEPLVVRLRFEPAGRAVGDVGQYYKMIKENRCVVCGLDDSYIRKNVVPREYRKYFPEIMKDRSSHDVLLLCGRCHQRSNMRDQTLRTRLAATATAPLQPCTTTVDDTCKKVRMAARALSMHGNKHTLPEDRIKELQNIVLSYYTDYSKVTDELLKEALELYEAKPQPDDLEMHGQAVVKYFLNKKPKGLLELEEIWREYFLSTMQPKYMPTLWSVKHTEKRLRIKWDEGRLTIEDLKLIGCEGW